MYKVIADYTSLFKKKKKKKNPPTYFAPARSTLISIAAADVAQALRDNKKEKRKTEDDADILTFHPAERYRCRN